MKLPVERRGPRMTALAVAIGLLSITVANSEQVFVADKLVLNVYSEPNQGGDKVATLETGDAVEALERAENFVRVRLQDGREGWVGASYLTEQAPAVVRLRELERGQKAQSQSMQQSSADEIARLKKQNAALQSEIDDLERRAAATPVPTNAPPQASVVEESQEPEVAPPGSAPAAATALSTRIAWISTALAVLAGLGGYILGYRMLARRVRQKFGGVKIY